MHRSVPTRPELENYKKNSEKFQKIKNIILASSQAETGRIGPNNREKNNFRFDPFLPDPRYRYPKNTAKKSKKLQNLILASSQVKTSQDRPKKNGKKKSF